MFKLLHGKFVVRNGLQPDGDTIRFKPDNVDFVEELRRGSRGRTTMNEGVNIRLEAVDALEKSQELKGATAARDELLRRLGFTDVRYSGNPPFTINSGDQEISGHVLSNGFDNFGRLIGFVYEGDGSVHGSDGSVISLDRSLVDESVNTALLSEGYVFPAFYDSLPENLREHLATKSTAARIAKKGVWLRSKDCGGWPCSSLEHDIISFIKPSKEYPYSLCTLSGSWKYLRTEKDMALNIINHYGQDHKCR
ncbi:nuclease [Fusarium oxysporum]|nr:nuclease [Fusarium oxysporum]